MIIECKDICKFYGKVQVLRDLNFSADKGNIVSIVGASGAGKTTLLQILGTILKPDGGSVLINGTDVFALSSNELAEFRNRKIGFVFQAFNLLPHLNLLEQVMVPMYYAGITGNKAKNKAMEALDRVGLSSKWHRHATQISGGEMQRVAIARAIVMDPGLLLADEPTGNLDTATSDQVMDIFQELNKSGSTVVLVTHEMDVAYRAKRIVHLKDGLIEYEESKA